MEPLVGKQVRAVWESARRGALLTGGYPPGNHREPASSLSARMQALQEERASLGPEAASRRADLDREEDALALQLREAKHAEATAAWLRDGLRSSIGRLDAAVTSLTELASQPAGGDGVDAFGASIETVREELSALHAGLSEVAGNLPDASGLPVSRRKP